jgi:hypothetical protein
MSGAGFAAHALPGGREPAAYAMTPAAALDLLGDAGAPFWAGKAVHAQVTDRDTLTYLREITPTNATPSAPCGCGDRVWYRLDHDRPWRCRHCQPISAAAKFAQWFISPQGVPPNARS